MQNPPPTDPTAGQRDPAIPGLWAVLLIVALLGAAALAIWASAGREAESAPIEALPPPDLPPRK